MRKYLFLAVVILLLAPAQALSQEGPEVAKYGFYGAVDSRNLVMNPANVVVDGEVYGFFTTANPRAYFHVEFKTIRAPFELLFKWVDPDGKTTEIPWRNTQQGVFNDYWVWTSIAINENRTLGVWQVVLLYNNREILEASFVLQTPQNVINRITSLVEENEELAGRLEKSEAEAKTRNEDLAKARSQLQQLETENSRLQTSVNELRNSLSKTTAELQQAQSENKKLAEQLTQEVSKTASLEQQRLILIAAAVVAAAAGAVAAVLGRRGRGLPPPPPP
ncbi:MAG: hypothetical protein QXS50_05175 [Candidatus Caldarchaeum sp.]